MRMHRSNESLHRVLDARRGQAEMLLAIAMHHTAREQVQLAVRDLDEAMTWLDRDSSTSPIGRLLDLAAWRLDIVRYALRDEGADTALPHTMTA